MPAYLGGIRDLEGLRNRCAIDPDSGCWHWRGATQNRVVSMGGKITEPRVWMVSIGGTTTISRAAWAMSGKPVPKAERWNVWRTCGNILCGNPAHMRAGTKAQWGEWVKQSGHLRGRPERSVINARAARDAGRTALTPEQVKAVRESQATGKELARRFDVSESVISRCRREESYRPTPCGSVFFWRP